MTDSGGCSRCSTKGAASRNPGGSVVSAVCAAEGPQQRRRQDGGGQRKPDAGLEPTAPPQHSTPQPTAGAESAPWDSRVTTEEDSSGLRNQRWRNRTIQSQAGISNCTVPSDKATASLTGSAGAPKLSPEWVLKQRNQENAKCCDKSGDAVVDGDEVVTALMEAFADCALASKCSPSIEEAVEAHTLPCNISDLPGDNEVGALSPIPVEPKESASLLDDAVACGEISTARMDVDISMCSNISASESKAALENVSVTSTSGNSSSSSSSCSNDGSTSEGASQRSLDATPSFSDRTGSPPISRASSPPPKERCLEGWFLGAVCLDDVGAARKCLERGDIPAQADLDAAMAFTACFVKREAMRALLARHGAAEPELKEPAEADEWEEWCHDGPYSSNSELFAEPEMCQSIANTEYEVAELYKPNGQELQRLIPVQQRAYAIAWMAKTCEQMDLDDWVLAGAVMIFDRFVVAQGTPLSPEMWTNLMMGAIILSVKITDVKPPLKYLLKLVTRGMVTVEQYTQVELAIIEKLNFRVHVDTPRHFLGAIFNRINVALGGRSQVVLKKHKDSEFDEIIARWRKPQTEGSTMLLWKRMASFFVDIAMYDIGLCYKWPLAVLAGGALGLAVLTLGAAGAIVGEDMTVENQPEHRHISRGIYTRLQAGVLPLVGNDVAAAENKLMLAMHDVVTEALESTYDEINGSAAEMLRSCEGDILRLWTKAAMGQCQWTDEYNRICLRWNVNSLAVQPGTPGPALLMMGCQRFLECHGEFIMRQQQQQQLQQQAQQPAQQPNLQQPRVQQQPTPQQPQAHQESQTQQHEPLMVPPLPLPAQ